MSETFCLPRKESSSPEAYNFPEALQPGCQLPQGQLGGLSTFSGRWERRDEQNGSRNAHPGVTAYPSLGLCQIKKDQMISACAGVCACVNTHTHKFSPRLHLITLDALLIIHSPNTKRPPPQPAPPPQLRLSFPTDLPRARNKLPIICIMLHDSLLHASNHFSISFRKNPSRIILSKLN